MTARRALSAGRNPHGNDVAGIASEDVDDHGSARRRLRLAVRDRDVTSLRKLLLGSCGDINAAVSDTSSCSALAYAVRCGHLEIVETLLELPDCHVDRLDRARRSPLDLALRAWIVAATSSSTSAVRSPKREEETVVAGVDGKHDVSRRFRIVRRLLDAGARKVSGAALDDVIWSVLVDDVVRKEVLMKLVKVYMQHSSLNHCHCQLIILSLLLGHWDIQ